MTTEQIENRFFVTSLLNHISSHPSYSNDEELIEAWNNAEDWYDKAGFEPWEPFENYSMNEVASFVADAASANIATYKQIIKNTQ